MSIAFKKALLGTPECLVQSYDCMYLRYSIHSGQDRETPCQSPQLCFLKRLIHLWSQTHREWTAFWTTATLNQSADLTLKNQSRLSQVELCVLFSYGNIPSFLSIALQHLSHIKQFDANFLL